MWDTLVGPDTRPVYTVTIIKELECYFPRADRAVPAIVYQELGPSDLTAG